MTMSPGERAHFKISFLILRGLEDEDGPLASPAFFQRTGRPVLGLSVLIGGLLAVSVPPHQGCGVTGFGVKLGLGEV